MPQHKNRTRKHKTTQLTEDELLVQKAKSQENPFDTLTAFHSFQRNGLYINFKCHKAGSMDKQLLDWAFDLLQRNMKKMYDESAWGWNPMEKLEEMSEDSATYLVGFNTEDKPVAFSHFRFDMDYGSPVLYCYEIQIEEECRRKGIARFMLQILELMAFRAQMEKVVLTVFLHNPAARQCFTSLGYTLDETSPQSTLEEVYDYEILSKRNKNRPKPLS